MTARPPNGAGAGAGAARLRWHFYGFALAVVLTLVLLLLPGDVVLAVKIWAQSWLPYAREVDQADWSVHADKLQHAGLFALLGALGYRAWQQRRQRLRVFAGVLLLGAGTELLQNLVPGRECSVWDFAADALGLALGWWLVRATLYRRGAQWGRAMLERMAKRLLRLPRFYKCALAMAFDAALCVLTVWLALWLRLEQWVQPQPAYVLAAVCSVIFSLPLFMRQGLYAAVFRFNGWNALLALGRAMFWYFVLYALVFTVVGATGVPRTVGLIQPLLLGLAVGASRVAVRFWLGDLYRRMFKMGQRRGVLVYGAGQAGRELGELLRHSHEYRLAGYLDDSVALQGRTVDAVRVYAPAQLPELVQQQGVTEVLLAMPSATRAQRLHVVDMLRQYPVHLRTLPTLERLMQGRVSLDDVHELGIEDLLGRDTVRPDTALMKQDIGATTVLVTGAGGSIGGELCRQIVRCAPCRLLLVERNEFALYSIHDELQRWLASEGEQEGLCVELVPLLASVQDESRMGEIMAAWRPQTVYHAAAYKHVPLVEHNVIEGVCNNVWGTWTCARLARVHGVRKFVLISTDKAVRPTNVMGASKRLAELVVQGLAHDPDGGAVATCMTMVRFGNVLGSSGSVVPRFRAQIGQGGPITLTHQDVTRYFMTIPEAAQLVIQAGTMAHGGDVFLLDMGEPVRIMDLARRMVELSGLRVRDAANPHGDIEIRITGLRPGEKLFEELLIDEGARPTSHPRILRARESHLPWPQLEAALQGMHAMITSRQVAAVRAQLQHLVPEYQPSSEVVDWMASSNAFDLADPACQKTP